MSFEKGKSGNPNGRPKGTTEATKLRKQITEHAPDIIQNLMAQANDGDIQASKILLDRVCPVLKTQALPTEILQGGTLQETGSHVVEATMTGSIPPDIGAQLIRALTDQSKLVEFEEMSQRLARIEKTLKNYENSL